MEWLGTWALASGRRGGLSSQLSILPLAQPCDFLKIIVLLRFRYHKIHVLVYNSVVCGSHRVVQPSPLSNSRTCSSPPKKSLCHEQSFLTPPPPSPWQLVIYFLSLWICPLCTFHINGIIQYVVFYVWLLSLSIVFSRFLHVVACTSTLFLFMAE